MKAAKFTLPEMAQLGFSVSYVDDDTGVTMNHDQTHIHEECEIYINLSGDVSFEVENRIYPIATGSVIITRPYEYHHCICHSNRRHEHYWITFSAGQNEDHLQMFFGREKGRDNLILLSPPQLERLCAVLDVLLEQDAGLLTRRIACLQLFQLLQEGQRGASASEPVYLPADVTQALQFMDAHLSDALDMSALCRACNVSQNTLQRHFRQALGVTPGVMLRKKRLIASLEQLRNGESVTEAALKSGFSDYSGYIQLFHRQFGLTPLQYKKKFAAQ